MLNLKEIGLVVPLLYLLLLKELMQRKYTKQILYDVDIFCWGNNLYKDQSKVCSLV